MDSVEKSDIESDSNQEHKPSLCRQIVRIVLGLFVRIIILFSFYLLLATQAISVPMVCCKASCQDPTTEDKFCNNRKMIRITETHFFFNLVIICATAEFLYNVIRMKCKDYEYFFAPALVVLVLSNLLTLTRFEGYKFVGHAINFVIQYIFRSNDVYAIEDVTYEEYRVVIIDQEKDNEKKSVVFFFGMAMIIGKYLLPRNRNQTSRSVSMIPIIFIGMAIDSFEFFGSSLQLPEGFDKIEDKDYQELTRKRIYTANRWVEIIWAFSLLQFSLNPVANPIEKSECKKKITDQKTEPCQSESVVSHYEKAIRKKKEPKIDPAYIRFRQFIYDDFSLIVLIVFQELPFLTWRLCYLAPDILSNWEWENFCFLFKNIATIYFTLHRLIVYLLDEDGNEKLEFQDLTKAWKNGGFVKNFIIGVIVVVRLFLGGFIAMLC